PPEEPSDASCALAIHAADLARAEQDHRDAQACRAYHARAAASVRVAAHDALFTRDLAAIPEDKWAHDGDYFERPLPLEGGGALFRVLFKGMAMSGIWRPRQKRLVDLINEAFSAKQKFEQCEILCVARTQVNYVTKLATDSLHTQIAKAAVVSAGKEKKENCTICLEDTDVSKIHAVEGCAHRFCFSCMKEHVKVKLLHGMLPACPQDGCTTKLNCGGFKDVPISTVITDHGAAYQGSTNSSNSQDLLPISQVLSLDVHERTDTSNARIILKMTCYDYKRRYRHARLEDAYLQNLAQQRLWRQCIRCKHMIELAEGCYHMTCVCGYEFCYTCGKEWKEKKATCSCPLWDERNIIRDDPQGNAGIHDDPEDEYDDYYDEDENNYYVGEGLQYNVDYHRQYDGGDRHHGQFYQYNR
uniref:RBR-type E3 ubiquitin transferase n=1 Tax=Oryza glaberrima TaxID=4538 RepID=I1QWY0_ORYGL